MAGWASSIGPSTTYAAFKKKHPDVNITREGFLRVQNPDRGKSGMDTSGMFRKLPKKKSKSRSWK